MIKSKSLKILAILANIAFLSVNIFVLPAAAQYTQAAPYTYAQNIAPAPVLEDSAVLAAQAQQAIKREVSVVARVKKLLAEDVQGLPHQRFLIELSNGTTVLIAHDLKMAPSVPIKVGDIVSIHGEYIWNKLGGLIHWTHHTDTPRHDAGWIDFNGVRYQ